MTPCVPAGAPPVTNSRSAPRNRAPGGIPGDLLAVAALAFFCAAPAMAADGTLLSANRTGGSVSLIDLPTGIEIARIPVGLAIPHEVTVSPDGRFALTSEYGPDEHQGRHVILIDIASASAVSRIDVGPDSRPHSAQFLPDGKRAVVTMQESDKIALVDLENGKVLRSYPTGGREGHMVRLSPNGSRAYVTSRGAEGTLSVIFLDEERDPVVIPTGAGAEGLAVSPDGSEVWVANRAETSISVVDTTTLREVARLESRPSAGRVEISADGAYAVVPNGGLGATVSQYLRLYDVRGRRLLKEVPLRDGGAGGGNFGIWIHGDQVYVSDPNEGTIQVFDLQDLGNRRVLVASHDAPDGMAWSPLRVNALLQSE